jgi:D,D-heptose 1,7-bisphosphate phosphatase
MRPPSRVRQAVILVGGKGTRLGVLTKATPKPMMEIGDARVFLDLLIDNIVRQGFDRVTLLAGYLGEQIVGRYDGRTIHGARIEVVIEPEPMGTGGALRFAADLLDDRFLLANGDSYFDMNYRRLDQLLAEHDNALGAIALRRVPDAGRYGSVEVTEQGKILAFREKIATSGAGDINAGVYLLSRSVLDLIPAGASSLEQDIFPALVARGELCGAHGDGYFIDIGLPETLAQAQSDLPSAIRRPAALLDRDGVLNHDHGYVHRWDDFDWVEDAPIAIRALNDAGFFVFVVTNQAGVAHGYYEEPAIYALHDAMRDALAAEGAFIDCFYHCPYHPEAVVERYRADDHSHRKPKPGMVLDALAEWPVDRQRSFLIGDNASDLHAGRGAGVAGHLFGGGSLMNFLNASGLVGEGISARETLRLHRA